MKKHSDRKIEIIEKAQNLFREKGYKATSMRDLAKEVSIKPASLYNHFDSKEEILKEICFDIADQFFKSAQTVGEDLQPDKKLEQSIKAHIQVIIDNLDASAVFLYEWRFLGEPALTEYKQLRDKYEDIYKKIIQDGIKKGIFKEVDTKFYCLTLFSSMNWIYNWYKPDGKFTSDDLSRMLIDLLFEGIKKT